MTTLLRMKLEMPDMFSIRVWRDVMRNSHREVGRYWLKNILPKHFEPGARARYGYKPRTERYMRSKAKTRHGTTDLVYTGRARDQLQSTGVVRGFPSRTTVTMLSPNYMPTNQLTSAKRNQPFMVGEFLQLTEDDRVELESIFAQAFDKYYNEALPKMAMRVLPSKW